MAWFVQLLVGFALNVIAYLLLPKTPVQKPSLDDFKSPTASAGRPRPVVQGTVTVKGLNVIYSGDKSMEERTAGGKK